MKDELIKLIEILEDTNYLDNFVNCNDVVAEYMYKSNVLEIGGFAVFWDFLKSLKLNDEAKVLLDSNLVLKKVAFLFHKEKSKD